LGWNANGVFAMLLKSLGHAKGRLYLGNGIADDEVNARGAAEVVKHVCNIGVGEYGK
jgi:hypothetical protein